MATNEYSYKTPMFNKAVVSYEMNNPVPFTVF